MVVPKPDAERALVRKDGILVHHGASRSTLDVGDFIRTERIVRHVYRVSSGPSDGDGPTSNKEEQ
ncbi:MAG: hypothetical protein OXM56_13505 [Gammaproteobacteria bacterium]|nr:hypothetical protein [Gammaproteobacteria bacterium]